MKDLLVYVADADAEAFLCSVLAKPQALGVRPFSFEIMRNPQRDAGMVNTGAELARMQKGKFGKALLLWDHHGSGRDKRQDAASVAAEIQNKLDSYTWSGNSAVTVLVPELEEWLWHCESALVAHCRISPQQLQQWIDEHAVNQKQNPAELKTSQPKELFEHIVKQKLRKTISPRDFEEIGKRAGIKGLEACPSFASICACLRNWFPL
ncbi:hypothetical protein JHS3_15290 [Jeongeupia sp. HS-3]|uniref:methylation-associated defense system protein MAD4 n=1 Tax=Jeongeupia sp. HS-3 TaxID=1009682 RepID=UPI0018A5C71B|nr:hypothetical protein [Jeongeupia sp. HS-3]BCL75793.1 hypothetical protein JHS3_15290 [Jeongeupia sp. HS-3]